MRDKVHAHESALTRTLNPLSLTSSVYTHSQAELHEQRALTKYMVPHQPPCLPAALLFYHIPLSLQDLQYLLVCECGESPCRAHQVQCRGVSDTKAKSQENSHHHPPFTARSEQLRDVCRRMITPPRQRKKTQNLKSERRTSKIRSQEGQNPIPS